MDTTLHELAHALVFDSSLYKLFIKPDGSAYGDTVVENITLRDLPTPHLKTTYVT